MIRRLLVRIYEKAFFSHSVLAKPVCYVMETGFLGLLLARTIAIFFKRRWTGYRSGDWMDSPFHHLAVKGLAISTNQFTLRHRFLNFVCCAFLKHREYMHTKRLNHVAILNHPVNQKTLRNLLVWQKRIYARNPVLPKEQPINVILRIRDGAEPSHLMDFFSCFTMLPHFLNLDFSWDDEAADAATDLTMSLKDRRIWARVHNAYDLAAADPADVRALEADGCPNRFARPLDSRKRFNDYMKAAAPGKVTIAVSLPEAEGGIVGPLVLARWVAILSSVRDRQPTVVFLLANRVAEWDRFEWPEGIRPLRDHGFTLMDVITAAQNAEGFVGVLDVVGLAAYSGHVPGVYMPLEPELYEGTKIARDTMAGDAGHQRRLTYMPEPEECVAMILGLVGILRPAYPGRPLLKQLAVAPAVGNEDDPAEEAPRTAIGETARTGTGIDARLSVKGE